MFHVEYRQRQIVMRTVEKLSARDRRRSFKEQVVQVCINLVLLVFLLLVFMQRTSKIRLLENFQNGE